MSKQYWSLTEGAFNCLIDSDRTEAFGRAIRAATRPGDVVVDAGGGTGILSLFALDAGAGRVYVVEQDDRHFATLAQNMRLNGYGDRVQLIAADARHVKLPEKVDVIICEMIATGLIEEQQVPVMNHLRQFAKPWARSILRSYESAVDLVWNNDVFYGHRLRTIRYEYPHEPELESRALSEKMAYSRVEFDDVVAPGVVDTTDVLNVVVDGNANGLRISGRTEFWDGSEFGASFAYSYPIVLPIEDMSVKRGQRIAVALAYPLCGGFDGLRWSVSMIG